MPYPAKLPGYEVVHDLVEQGVSADQIAIMYGAHPKSVKRLLQRGRAANGEARPRPVRKDRFPKDDLVNGLLIYGEIYDFMNGWGVSREATAKSLRLEHEVIDHVLANKHGMIERNLAHRVVGAVMSYERRHGVPPDQTDIAS